MVFVDWWMELERFQQVLWSLAIVSGILLFILLFISFFGFDRESERPPSGEKRRRFQPVEPKTVLAAMTLFSWMAVFLSYQTPNLQVILLASAAAGLVGSLLPWLLSPLFAKGLFDADAALSSTGEVLQSVPPHRNGFGKVHLNLRAAPFEMDAVTAGEELPAGAPVRIVGIIDDRVLLVEPLEQTGKDPASSPDPGNPAVR